jgi:hypothetical protein
MRAIPPVGLVLLPRAAPDGLKPSATVNDEATQLSKLP